MISKKFLLKILEKRVGGREIDKHREPHWTIGLVEEAGEVAGLIKKELYHGHARDDKKFLNECGDVLFYLTCLIHDRGYELKDAMQANIDKLEKRYPNGFTREASINRKNDDA